MPRPRRPRRDAAVLFIAAAAGRAQCCSFIAASFPLDSPGINLTWANELNRLRGPDATSVRTVAGWGFLHNLLHMTGERTLQPFVDSAGSVAALFNGEVYNWRELAAQMPGGREWKSDGHALLPIYLSGNQSAMIRRLQGEFAIVVGDFREGRREVTLMSDPFLTKPLWYALWDGRFAAASYASALLRLGAPQGAVQLMRPNTAQVRSADPPFAVLRSLPLVEWDLRQHKTHTGDWAAAFDRAVRTRVANIIHRPFVGLSGGFDSGAIAAALLRSGTRFFAYHVVGKEHQPTVDERFRLLSKVADGVRLREQVVRGEREWLLRHCEPYNYSGVPHQGPVWDDPGSHALSALVRRVRRRRGLIYLSGTGADEIVSDYAYAPGVAVYSYSALKGDWPQDLRPVFPWANFYGGVMRSFIMKEELVGGAHGIETRYPFLDPAVVQEFLWLTPAVKRSEYKRPIADYLRSAAFPFATGKKQGFNAAERRPKRGRARTRPFRGAEEVVQELAPAALGAPSAAAPGAAASPPAALPHAVSRPPPPPPRPGAGGGGAAVHPTAVLAAAAAAAALLGALRRCRQRRAAAWRAPRGG
eukprot:TRINITY_DN26445_c0_g1_i1.p1 TRINITY_DN26445_c0_g1~~TRINITY_DN26445_c0_g1_i1.p1  ORF type:complete len:630 (+),score=207.98 TRINITY_DN26445_c0_g1_i1:130-1890(+)